MDGADLSSFRVAGEPHDTNDENCEKMDFLGLTISPSLFSVKIFCANGFGTLSGPQC